MIDRLGYRDRQGRILSHDAWTKLLENGRYRRVRYDTLDNGVTISTVWLGMNHQHGKNGPPLIFETMVFPPRSSEVKDEEQDMERYETEELAIKGHEKYCIKWNDK